MQSFIVQCAKYCNSSADLLFDQNATLITGLTELLQSVKGDAIDID